MTKMRSDICSNSSKSSLKRSTAVPLFLADNKRWWISETDAKSSPNTGLLTKSNRAVSESSRAKTARCTLPPDN